MDPITIAYIVIIALLIVCSAFFSMSETAFTSANQVRLKKMAKDGDKRAEKTLRILENYDKFLTTILIGNNLVNIGASSLATTAIALILVGMASSSVSLISTVVMTIIVLICGEITPKTVAKRNPEKYAMRVCGIVSGIEKLFSPVSWCFTKFTNAIGRRAGTSETTMTEDELEVMIDEIEDGGVLEESESRLIKSAIRFDDTQVGEVFVPRVDVTAIEASATPEELGKMFTATGYSRIPVYDGSIDNIIGVVYSKEFFASMFNGEKFSIRDIMRPMKYVPETMSIADILSDFQKSKVHMAVVLDSYGGTMGIVTLEDILEAGVRIGDGPLAELGVDVLVDELHRARPVEGVEGDQLLDRRWLLALEDVGHAVRFELEDAFGVAPVQHVECLPVMLIDPVYVEIRGVLVDQLDSVLDEGERLEAEEVHLHKPAVLDLRHRILRSDGSRLRVDEERYVMG